jgi:hypothetical protein
MTKHGCRPRTVAVKTLIMDTIIECFQGRLAYELARAKLIRLNAPPELLEAFANIQGRQPISPEVADVLAELHPGLARQFEEGSRG